MNSRLLFRPGVIKFGTVIGRSFCVNSADTLPNSTQEETSKKTSGPVKSIAEEKFVPNSSFQSEIEFSGKIDLHRLKINYSRSSGPGGQHVNKTASQAEIRLNLAKSGGGGGGSDWIPNLVQEKILEKNSHRMTKEGDLILRSDKFRVAAWNLADCLEKLRTIFREAVDDLKPRPPDPEKEANLRRLAARENRRRLELKRSISAKKRLKEF